MRSRNREDVKGCEAEIGQAAANDYRDILDLQKACYIGNLTPEERRDGFLSAEFSAFQIEEMLQDLGIVVAKSADRVVGYMCASRVELAPRPPILDAMMECLGNEVFGDKPLSQARMFVYGPVCIHEAYRGAGLLKRMFGCLKASLTDRFEVGVAFVADDNPRSLAAHVRGLSMKKVARFQYEGKDYHAVAFSLAPEGATN